MLLAVRVDDVLDGRKAATSSMSSRPADRLTRMSTIETADERALVAAARAGDERAFRRARRAAPPRARDPLLPDARLAPGRRGRRPGDAAAAPGAALERFERRASIQTWLYRIATNACLDELERRPRRPAPVQPYPDARVEQTADAGRPTRRRRYAQREGMELAFLTAIQPLPGRQRAVLILRDVLGWTGARGRRAARHHGRRASTARCSARGRRSSAELPRARAARAAARRERELLRALRRRLGARRRRRPRRAAARGRRAEDAAGPRGARVRRGRRFLHHACPGEITRRIRRQPRRARTGGRRYGER